MDCKVLGFAILTVIGHYVWPISKMLGEAATTEWVNHQIAERYGIVSPSQQQVIDFTVSWALPAFAVLLAYALFRGGGWWERKQTIATPAGATVSIPTPTTQIVNHPSPRAKIIFGTGRFFETVERVGANNSRTVQVQIQNKTDDEISNGTMSVVNLDPPNKGHKDFLLKCDIRIGPRKYSFIDVAAYNEGTSEAKPGPWIRLLIPMPSGPFLFNGLPGNLPIIPHTFQLQFSTLGNDVLDKVYCRIFVDQDHVLHLEDWGNSAKRRDVSEAREISLMEAVTRAHEEIKDKPISIVIEGFANSPDDILTWLCNALTRYQDGNEPLVKLRGNKPPSRVKEEIHMAPLSAYDFIVEGQTIVFQERHGQMRYEALSVSTSELEPAIQNLASREV